MNDALIKRKPFLESFLDGLSTFQFKNLIKSNPKLFEPMFVHNGRINAGSIKDIIHTESPPGGNITKLRILQAIGIFLDECSEEGKNLI